MPLNADTRTYGTNGVRNEALQGQYISLSINGNTAASWTVTQVRAEADW